MENKSIKGTRTEQNLMMAFLSELQSKNRYVFFASVAHMEGYEQVASIFLETSEQEMEHAKRMLKWLDEGDVLIEGYFPSGVIGSTAENLESSAEEEFKCWNKEYAQYVDDALREGYGDVAAVLRAIIEAERGHESRFRRLLERVEGCWVFSRDHKVFWQCRNCGFIIESQQAPSSCPACGHSQAYFEIMKDNY